MPKEIEPGIHPDIPMEDYIADPCPEPSVSKGDVHVTKCLRGGCDGVIQENEHESWCPECGDVYGLSAAMEILNGYRNALRGVPDVPEAQRDAEKTIQEGGVVLTVTARSNQRTWAMTMLIGDADFARMDDESTLETQIIFMLRNLLVKNLR